MLVSAALCTQGIILLEKNCVSAQTPDVVQAAPVLPGTPLPEEIPPTQPLDPRQGEPPSRQPLPEQKIEPLPDPDRLLPPTPTSPDQTPIDAPQKIRVKGFQVTGSTVFSQQELVGAIVQSLFKGEPIPPAGREISLADLFQVRSAITELYTSRGYITSGAYIPAQRLEEGVIEVRVLEGSLEDIRVTGTQKLEPGYVSSRIGIATRAPLNRDRLLEALQLLQLNPLIANISAELSAGSRPGTSLLDVKVTEADSSFMQLTFDNGRSPSVGTIRRQVSGTELNTLGYGDAISLAFTNTDGSNALDFSYTLPVSPYNTTINFSAGLSASDVIEEPFDILDIHSESNYLELTGRHPLIQTPTQDLALGLTLGRRSTRTRFIEDLPFPSPGADDEGRTKVSVLRFFQEWTQRSSTSVFAVRSQFNFGVPIFNASQNDDPPDSNFFSWRSQAQWVRLLAPDTLLLVRGDLQLADRPILPVEQFGLGGLLSIRGYRQDLLLTDNGLFGSVEVRIPVLRLPKQQALFQFTPFVDFGRAWNNADSPDPDPGTLASLGFGLRLQISNNFTARMDFGFPLVSVDSRKETWQEKGIYFSIIYSPF
ncbi:MAG: ShlB/FhaC/HecB family hemolysin secretion/activation protein [Leptolyngbyaceae cyanobacterium RU_5_1]|nr:ShlB/FhaC/HecB family hemolysin secretion/activation protein [Leptolyngbyaceae cyanobacterium RU_5_1]